MPPFGLWELVSQRSPERGTATERQLTAARYLIGDMPRDAVLGFEAARELLSVRSYIIGMLASLYRQGAQVHPREAIWFVLQEAYRNPAILSAIRKWSGDRFFEDRGPARVGGTRYFNELRTIVEANCRSKKPHEDECLAVRDVELRSHGLSGLLTDKSATIDYFDGDETTTRTISEIQLTSNWPWWAFWLVGAPAFISVDAFCHLRHSHRTFAAMKITRVR